MKRWLIFFPVLAALLLIAAAPANTPAKLGFVSSASDAVLPPPDSTDGLVPGTESRVSWYDGERRTEWAVVALHGFSASRQETAPLADKVATALAANLYEARLSGHGLQEGALHDVRAEDWLGDTERALAAGAALGDRIVLIGTSTGATLMIPMLDSPLMRHVDTMVMLSPNFRPQGSGVDWLTRPYGPFLASIIAGETRSWEPHNALQGTYWTTSYPTAAVIEVMRLVDRANAELPATIDQRLLVFYSRDDRVVSPDAIRNAFELLSAPAKALVEITDPGDPSHHVLAGEILSPGRTDEIAAAILEFISRPVP